jgi:hypothetical protein
VHKIDKVKPLPDGRAAVVVEDERNAAAMSRVPGLSTVIAIARVLNAKRVVETKLGGKGEVRYAVGTTVPSFLLDAIVRAGAVVTDSKAERVIVPASPASVSAVIDHAFAELAHHVRVNVDAEDMSTALRIVQERRRKAPLDREAQTTQYWTAVFELAAVAGELFRSRGGRWIETAEMPVPFAVKLATGEIARPPKLAQRIVEGAAEETLAS